MIKLKKAGLFAFVIFMLLMLVSCGGLKTRFSIRAKDVISGECLSIRMYVKRSNVSSPSERFSVRMNLEELSEAIAKKVPSLSATVYQDQFILLQTESGFFFLTPIEKAEEDTEDYTRYVFFAPVAMFKIDTPIDTYVYMYVPYHLIKGIVVQTSLGYPEEYLRTLECDACGSIDDFINFYSNLEQCEVEKTGDDRIVVTNKKNGYPMELRFYRDREQPKVTFTILEKGI